MASRKDNIQILASVYDPATNSLRISGDGGGGVGGTGATSFLGLSDTPASFAGSANRTVKVNASGTGLDFFDIPTAPTRFTQLADAPGSLIANKWLQVNSAGTAFILVDAPSGEGSVGPKGDKGDTGATGSPGVGVPVGGTTGQVLAKSSNVNYATQWITPSAGGGGATSFLTLTDTPSTFSANMWLKANASGTALEWTAAPTGGSGSTTFTGLSDVPDVLVSNKWVKINSAGTGLEFVDAPSGTGVNGTNGSVWHSGTAAPSAGTGVEGDYYLNTTNGQVFKKVSGTWTSQINLTGPQGTAGQGVPTGGTTGQILAKTSATNYATQWINAPTGGSGSFNGVMTVSDLVGLPTFNITSPDSGSVNIGGSGTSQVQIMSGATAVLTATTTDLYLRNLKFTSTGSTTVGNVLAVTSANTLGFVTPSGGGATGPQGPAGVGISTATVNGSGRLILTKTDATTVDAGVVVGATGPQGPAGSTGPAGVGITTATVNGSGRLIVTKTDSTTVDAGSVIGPKGDTGNTGSTGATGATGPAGPGVPTGGTAGQILAKVDGTNYNTQWIAAPTGGGGSNLTLLSENTTTNTVRSTGVVVVDKANTGYAPPTTGTLSDAGLVVGGNGGGLMLHGSGSDAPIRFTKSAGTVAAPTAVPNGATIGLMSWHAHSGSGYRACANMYLQSKQTQSSSANGAHLHFEVCPINAAAPESVLSLMGNENRNYSRITQSNFNGTNSIQDLRFTGQTTSATPVNLTNSDSANYGTAAIGTGKAATFHIFCTARRLDTGTEFASFEAKGLVHTTAAGVTTINQIVPTTIFRSDASWTMTPVVSGNDLVVQVAGALGKTVNWTASVKLVFVG